MRSPRVVAVAVVAVVGACSSNYIPRRPGHVAMILQNGSPAYVRDGRVYQHGLMGGGLLRAVQGNPAAEQAAHEYRSRIGNGLAAGLVGMTCMVGGAVYAGMSAEDSNVDERDRKAMIGGIVALGCSVLMFGGFGYMATAEPYRYDAINIFNDTEPQMPFYGGAPGAQAEPQRHRHEDSLHMRSE